MGIEEFYKFLAEHKPEELVKIIEARNKEVQRLKAEHKKMIEEKEKDEKSKPKQ